MKRLFFLLMLAFLASFHLTSYASSTQYKHSSYDLGIAKRHNIDECRINDIVGDEVFFFSVEEDALHHFVKAEFFLINTDTGVETKIPYTLENTFFTDAHYSGKYLYILYHDKDDYQCILQVDKKGNTVGDFRLKNIEAGQCFYNIDVKEDERIFASGNVGIAEYDLKGTQVWYVPFSPFMRYSKYVSGNRLYVMDDLFLHEIDIDNNKLTGSKLIYGVQYPYLIVYDGKLYSFDDTGVKLINTDKENWSYVVKFSDYGIKSGNFAIDISDAGLRFIDYNPFDKNTSVTLHTIDYSEQGQKKKELLFSFPDYMPFPGEVHEVIDGFNRSNPDYEMLYNTYEFREDLDTFMANNSPDVVLMLDSDVNRHKGLFADIMPYMNGSGDLKPSSLLPAVLNNYTEGKSLYMLPIELSLYSYAMKSGDYSKDSMSTEDFLAYIGRDGLLCTDCFLSKESITRVVLEAGLSEYVDFDKGTCAFNSAKFKSLIDKIDALGSENVYFPDTDYMEIGRNDRMLDDCRISGFDFFGKKRAVYGEDVKTVGRPAAGDGTYIMSALCMALCSGSDCTEGAFEFIEYFATHYCGEDREGTITANKEFFDATVEELKKSLKVTDFFGTETAITEKDIAAIAEAIDNSMVPDARSAAILDYVSYYTDMYYSGRATIDEVLEDLQATVTAYLK